MLELRPPFRRAIKDDAPALAELVNYAGEGMPLYLWAKMAESGESPWDVGRRRAEREEGSFSYCNAVVIEHGGECAGCLIGYEIPEQPSPASSNMPAMFVPLQELENLAAGTWYINVLAVQPPFRGKGLGTKLLSLAHEIGGSLRRCGLSLIVSDANLDAQRLYVRCGFAVHATRPMVKEDWEGLGKNWLLLTKALSDSR
jgi:ribosomal protein S18 acetylase RimI-like enzyme